MSDSNPWLKFRADEKLRLRVARAALFYKDASEMMRNRIILHLQDEETSLGMESHEGRVKPVGRVYEAYCDLPPQLRAKYDELTHQIDRLSSTAARTMSPAAPNSKPERKVVSRKIGTLRDIRCISLSVFGTIPAGWPDNVHSAKPQHTVLVPKGEFPASAFGLIVHGDSMNNARGKLGSLLDGDTVILVSVERRESKSGDIVAALCDGQTTLKRLRCRGKECYLHPESTNPVFANDIKPAHDLVIQGVVVGKL